MKRTIVNHGGNIQWKFIISNDEELLQYAQHKSTMIGEEFLHMIQRKQKNSNEKDSPTQTILKITSEKRNVPLVVACDVLLQRTIMTMQEMLLEGYTLVVNQAGGYCPFDDKCMTILESTEENIEIANGPEQKHQIDVDLEKGPFIVLENQSWIPKAVKDYLYVTLQVPEFSYIKNIQYGREEMSGLIKEALESGHHTFVAQSALVRLDQIKAIADIMDAIPYKVSFLINAVTGSDKTFRDILNDVLGQEKTDRLFAKHNITEWV